MTNNIRYYRLLLNRSIKDIAEKAGINDSTLRKYETFVFVPSVDNAFRIADALGVDINDLFRKILTKEEKAIVTRKNGTNHEVN